MKPWMRIVGSDFFEIFIRFILKKFVKIELKKRFFYANIIV